MTETAPEYLAKLTRGSAAAATTLLLLGAGSMGLVQAEGCSENFFQGEVSIDGQVNRIVRCYADEIIKNGTWYAEIAHNKQSGGLINNTSRTSPVFHRAVAAELEQALRERVGPLLSSRTKGYANGDVVMTPDGRPIRLDINGAGTVDRGWVAKPGDRSMSVDFGVKYEDPNGFPIQQSAPKKEKLTRAQAQNISEQIDRASDVMFTQNLDLYKKKYGNNVSGVERAHIEALQAYIQQKFPGVNVQFSGQVMTQYGKPAGYYIQNYNIKANVER